MADSYHIIDGKVVPYSGGRKCNDTDAWRDATPLELQLQEQLEEYEHANAALQAEIDALRTRLEDTVRDSTNKIEALRAEVEAWRELSDHVRVGACAAIWPDRYTDARTRDVAAALKRAARLEEALEEIRSRSSIDLAMRSDQFELTARLGDIHQIADSALSNGGKA